MATIKLLKQKMLIYHTLYDKVGTMIIRCPECGKSIVVQGLGRKAFKMPVTKVCDALRLHNSVLGAATDLGCSRAYIYKVLKTNGLTAKEILEKS